jgi:hypothetical protein
MYQRAVPGHLSGVHRRMSGAGTVTDTEALPAEGPTVAALRLLRDWLADAIGSAADVVVAPPSGATTTRLCLWPVAVVSDQAARGGHGPQPLRLRMRYAVAADGPIEDALKLLDLVFAAIVAQEVVRLVVDPADRAPRALSGSPSATSGPPIQIDVPVQFTPAAKPITRVRGELRLDGSVLVDIYGRLVGPHDVPLAEMTVTASTTGVSAVSGPGGDFRLPGLPSGRATTLHISGRGLHLQVEVPPDTTDVVVIHCNIEEV